MDDSSFSLRKIALAAYGPSVLFGVGIGAMTPVIALSVRGLGASYAVAGLVAALVGLGSLVSNIPAALLVNRYGERRAMIGASLLSAVAMLIAMAAHMVWMMAVATLLVGAAASVFQLARQSYLVQAVPLAMRARALSVLGGTARIGAFVGPFAGAGLIALMDLPGAYLLAMIAMLGAGVLAYKIPDLEVPAALATVGGGKASLLSIARSHAGVFLSLGIGVLMISVLRATRQVVLPLWAEQLGLDSVAISVIYGLVAALDMAVFYHAGKVMDRHGRVWVAVPSVLLMGASLMLMPFASGVISFMATALMLGFGNGISSGIVMTLAADAAPAQGRHHFLGLWRLMSDVGSSAGPLLLSALTGAISLAVGTFVVGTFGLAAAAVFWRCLPHGPGPYRRKA